MVEAPAILSWHRVAHDPIDPFGLCTPPEVFRAQLAQLQARFRIRPLEALVWEAEAGGGHDAVALTLDDGYEDALATAAPLLAEAGACATFFVTSAPLDGAAPFFWDTLAHALLGHGPRPACFDEHPTATAAEREVALRGLHRHALALPREEREALIARLSRWAGDGAGARLPRPLDADGVRALAAQPGCTIGAHGVHHLALPSLPTDVLAAEVRDSRDALASVLGRAPAAFAYPFGAYDARAVEAAAAAGFELAVTVEARPLARAEPRLRLPRIDAHAFLGAGA
jgi:peptidoglycan/xylan/chitin deacetylase (PgdA/CDA1 family)